MIVATYHYSMSGCVCALLIKNQNILDISVSVLDNPENKNKRQFVKHGTRMCAGLVRREGINGNVKFCYPSVLRGNQQQKIADRLFDNKDIDSIRHPLSIPSALSKMSEKGLIKPAYDGLEEPVRVYTDASVQEKNGMPTVGCALIDDNNSILSIRGDTLDGHRKVSVAEFEAGCLGLENASDIGINNAIWVSDNRDAQDIFRDNSSTSGIRNQKRLDRCESLKNSFKDFSLVDIDGNDNILADAIAEDMRRDITQDRLIYQSLFGEN
jgi:ribonuclease HI